MAAPSIITTQDILEYLQFETFVFQPAALNDPISWMVTSLPPGLDFETGTGRISGAATSPGIWDCILTATNADGDSTPLVFTIAIEATSYAAQFDAVDLNWDTMLGLVTATQAAVQLAKLADDTDPLILPIVFWLKRGDVRMIHVRPMKNGVVMDIEFTTLKLSLKRAEPETVVVNSSGFVRVGEGPDTFYRVFIDVTGAYLDGALSDQEDDGGTQVVALGELEYTCALPTSPALPDGVSTTGRTSSLNFGVGIARDLTPNA